jgi:hypothetical protein
MMKTLLIATCFLLPSFALAAIEVDIESPLSVNAVEGSIMVSKSVNVKDIYTGNSQIVFWISGPKYDTESHRIDFAGLSPGGFQGKAALFTLEGDMAPGDLKLSELTTLANDGSGTPIKAKLSFRTVASSDDAFAPEPFSIALSNSDELFDGKTFASFSAVDKGLGIDHYEVAEKLIGTPNEADWQREVSPYEVHNRALLKEIYVKAVDKAGNYRIESIPLPRRRAAYIFLAIILVALCAFALRKRSSRFS